MHWLFIVLIIGIAFYLPFLIFGAFPYNTKTNTNPVEMENFLMELKQLTFMP